MNRENEDRALSKLNRDLFHRMHPALQLELARNSDASIRRAIEFVGNPSLTDDLKVAIFGTGEARASLFAETIRKHACAHAIGPQYSIDAMRMADQFNEFRRTNVGFGADPSADSSGQIAGDPGQIRRHPYSIFGAVTMNTGPSATTDAPGSIFTNGTGWSFVITHINLSMGASPTQLNPTFRIQFSPQSGDKWSPQSQRADANAVMTNLLPMPPPNVQAFCQSSWDFNAATYRMSKTGSLFVQVANNNPNEAISATVLVFATKLNSAMSPRLFAATFASDSSASFPVLAAGAGLTALPTLNYQNDGGEEAEIHYITTTSGNGNWGLLNPSAPSIFVRPGSSETGSREFMNNATTGVIATSLNNRAGNLGGFWRLPQPQRIPTNTAINFVLEETQGDVGTIANVNFIGYLEVKTG